MTLPDKWRRPRKARTDSREAWWYGEEKWVHVCIWLKDGGVVSCRLPKRELLKWADAVRETGKE